MEIINRVKNILVSPKTEWAAIDAENAPHAKVFMTYVVPLAAIPAIAAFIGYGLIGYSVLGIHVHSVSWGIRQAIMQYVLMLGGTYLTAFIINMLADSFGAKKDFDRAFSLVATPIRRCLSSVYATFCRRCRYWCQLPDCTDCICCTSACNL
jgi:hypothetical protein